MILDTTVLIDLMRGDEDAVEAVGRLETEGAVLWVPAPVLFELWEGMERADRPDEERRRIDDVLHGYTLASFDPGHAAHAGRLSGAMVRRGKMMDPLDAQIAGTALATGQPVMTRNRRDFERVDGLGVVPY